MKWLECIRNRFHKVAGDDVAEYRKRVEKEVQDHWTGRQIRLGELICDCWQKPVMAPNNLDSPQKYNYLVFIDVEGDLDWICEDEHTANKVSPETLGVIAQIMNVEAIPCKHLAKTEWLAFKRMLGTAIVSAFEGEIDSAKTLMHQAQSYIEHRIPERSRLWALRSALCALGAYGFVLYLLRNTLSVEPFIFGLLGALVSFVKHVSARQTDSNAGKALHCTEAFVRLLIGMIFGKMGVLFFCSAIAPEFSRNICTTNVGIRVIAFAAGLFDAFIPAMISTYLITPLNSKEDSRD